MPFKTGDKVVVFQPDGEELRGVVILTETLASGVKVRVRSGEFILNVDEKQVATEGRLAFVIKHFVQVSPYSRPQPKYQIFIEPLVRPPNDQGAASRNDRSISPD